jgi:beta-glucosidase
MVLLTPVTILVIGTNGEWEAESYDRDNIKLPGYTDPLVRAVLTANPLAVIVNQSGMPVEFPWVDQAGALVQAFLGGNECGSAIADVIFGKTNPSGKLPISWPVKLQDYPAPEDFGHRKTTVYREGIHVGYRHFDHGGPASAFPFGYGLSYTAFEVS